GRSVTQFRLSPFADDTPAEVSPPVAEPEPDSSSVEAAPVAEPAVAEAPAESKSPGRAPRLAALSARLEETLDAVARVDGAPPRPTTFTARHPARCVLGRAHTFLVFAAPSTSGIRPGTPVTVALEPTAPGIEVDPPQITQAWGGTRLRYPFEVRVAGEVGDRHLVRVSVQVAGVEVARVARCVLEVVEAMGATEDRQAPTGSLYRRIFVSAAADDASVERRLAVVRDALGADALIDVPRLRAAADWRPAVREAIDEADVFQLFWSERAAASEACGFEWRRAQKVAAVRDGYVRVVQDAEGGPEAPEELASLRFAPIPAFE
ncbi:MAG: toll/interleukin-1 receptor domain-containing protein, partial [Myxococcota bacterium]